MVKAIIVFFTGLSVYTVFSFAMYRFCVKLNIVPDFKSAPHSPAIEATSLVQTYRSNFLNKSILGKAAFIQEQEHDILHYYAIRSIMKAYRRNLDSPLNTKIDILSDFAHISDQFDHIAISAVNENEEVFSESASNSSYDRKISLKYSPSGVEKTFPTRGLKQINYKELRNKKVTRLTSTSDWELGTTTAKKENFIKSRALH